MDDSIPAATKESTREDPSTFPVGALPSRKIKKETAEYFDMRVGLSPADGATPIIAAFPYTKNNRPSGWKLRNLDKKMFSTHGYMKRDVEPFGWQQAISSGSKRLYVTEGELDAMSVYQVLRQHQKREYSHLVPAVISVPHGAQSALQCLNLWADEIVRKFQEVVLVFDNDEPGKDAQIACTSVLPNALTVSLPANDPNDCLMKGLDRALNNTLVFKAYPPKTTSIVALDTLVEEALAPVPEGLAWPWASMTDLTRGLRFGETHYIGSGVKMGKTDIANALTAWYADTYELPVYMANFEETNVRTTKKVVGKVTGRVYHDPKKEYNPDDFRADARRIKGKVHFVNAFQSADWSSVKRDIIYSVHHLGVKIVMVDPITNFTNSMVAGEADAFLRGFAQEVSTLARDLNVAVFLFCHCKAPDSGPTHEMGGKVRSAQFTGSRAMARACNYMWGLQGTKDPALPVEQRNTRELVLLEDREYGESGIIKLYWDQDTQLFSEIK